MFFNFHHVQNVLHFKHRH